MTKRRKEHEVLGKYAGTDTGIRARPPQINLNGKIRELNLSKIVLTTAHNSITAFSGKLTNPGTRNK